MRKAKFTRFRRLGSVLPRVVKSLGLGETVAAQPAVNEWPRLAGERIAQHARAVAVDRGVLVVVVDSPAWMTQLAFLKPELLRKVAARVGRGRVKDLRLVLGHGPTRDSA